MVAICGIFQSEVAAAWVAAIATFVASCVALWIGYKSMAEARALEDRRREGERKVRHRLKARLALVVTEELAHLVTVLRMTSEMVAEEGEIKPKMVVEFIRYQLSRPQLIFLEKFVERLDVFDQPVDIRIFQILSRWMAMKESPPPDIVSAVPEGVVLPQLKELIRSFESGSQSLQKLINSVIEEINNLHYEVEFDRDG